MLEQVCFELGVFVLSQVFGMELEQVDCEEAVDCVVWVTVLVGTGVSTELI